MSKDKNRVCPVERAGHLDTRTRRWIQNPRKILKPHVKEGMTVLDVGCGPGFFTVEMARMVGDSGRVIAVDLQEGMLQIVRDKVKGSELEERITLKKCEENTIAVTEEVDFVLLFYVVHEIPDKDKLFKEVEEILSEQGKVLIVEPPFHVSRSAFAETISKANEAGLSDSKGPRMFFCKTRILEKPRSRRSKV